MDIQQQYDVTFVGVPGSNDLDSVSDFVDDTDSNSLTHVTDPDGELWSRFDVQRRQTYVLVDATGAAERIEFDDLSTRIGALSAQSSTADSS